MKKITWLLLLLLPLFIQAQSIQEKADTFLTAYTNQNKFSGTVLIAKGNSIIFNKAYGFADLSNKKLNTTETEFRAGSLTKMFTSNLILRLASGHRISLNDVVSKYIPADTWADNITIKNLLTHTSGIHGSTPQNALTATEMIDSFKPESTAFIPNQQFEYNNFNYLLLAYIAEKVTGKNYASLLRNEVLDKVEMNHSGIDSFERKSNNKAYGYTVNPNTNEWIIIGNYDKIKAASGAGALYTTTGDLFKWSRFVLHKISIGDTMYANAVKPVMADYGMGWIVREQNGHKWFGHTGTVEGFNAMLAIFPADNITIIYLSNFQDLNTPEFEKNLIALVFNQPYKLPVVKKEIILSENELNEYTGTYGEDANMEIKIVVENAKLFAIAPGGDKIELSAEAKDKFFMKGADINVQFNRDNNNIISVFISMGNQTLKKIN